MTNEKDMEYKANWEALAAAIVGQVIIEYDCALRAEKREGTKYAKDRVAYLDKWFESDYAIAIMHEDPVRVRDKLRENFKKYGQVKLPNQELVDYINRR